jgi:hypothetical protein
MKIMDFCEAYKAKRFINTKQGVDEKSEWFRNELEIKSYIPFREKRRIAEMIVEQNIEVVDGIKKYDDISSYVSLIVASIAAHTNLQFGEDPVADYDLLAESGLLPQIIAEFQGSHEEIGILLKMAVASELEDNNTNVIIGHFLDNILKKLDGFGESFKNFDIQKILGNIKEEDMAKLIGLLDKIK